MTWHLCIFTQYLWLPVWGVHCVSASFDPPLKPFSSNPLLVSSFGSTVTVSQIPDSIGYPSSCGTGQIPVSNLLMDPCWKLLSWRCARGQLGGWINHYFALCSQTWGNAVDIQFVCVSQSLDVIHPQHSATTNADRRIWQTWSNFPSAM